MDGQTRTRRPAGALRRGRFSFGAALAVLALGLAATGLAAWSSANVVREDARQHFRNYADRLVDQIARRVHQAESGLRGARAMIASVQGVNRLGFRSFVAARELHRDLPGVRSLGLVERVPRPDLPAFIARERADHAPRFDVRTSGAAPDLLVVKYIEPHPVGVGIDIGADPVRREAAERALAMGEPALSASVTLVRENAKGWLLFLPVDAVPRAPAAAPRAQEPSRLLMAIIGAPEVLGGLKAFSDGQIDFELFDGEADADPPVFDSRGPPVGRPAGAGAPRLQEVRPVLMGGRAFALRITSTPELEAHFPAGRSAALVAVAGAALSLLLALAVFRVSRGRDRAEALGRERERLIRLINDSIPARLSYWGRDLRCRLANRRFAAAYGRTPQEMLGCRLGDLLPRERFPDALKRARAALQGEAQQFEASVVPGRTALAHYVPDFDHDEVRGFFVFALDITELKQAREEAQRASAAKSQFLSNMSHEIRTPLNAVLGMLALLRMTPLEPRQCGYAAKAEAAARSLLSLLNDVLDFSKIEAGKMALDPRPFAWRALLDELSVILAATLGEKPIALRFEVDPALPEWLLGDDMRLRQVLINLGGNAVKFTHRGEVAVTVRQLARAGDRVDVEVAVSDTGIGISPEDQQRIFSDFSQAAASTTREFGGTGLGLAICSRLAALMGGTLRVESRPGCGSRFLLCVQLPVAAAPPSQPSRPEPVRGASEAPRSLQGCRLLVAEDNPINQQVARELLEAAGAEVVLAANGREAVLAVAGRGPFDAVLMDVQMPVMDGYQATREIRGALRLQQLPIIALTANAMDGDREESRAAGMDDHLGKPFAYADLIETILRHARPQAAAPAAAAAPASPRLQDAVIDAAGAIQCLEGDEALFHQLVPLFCRDLREAQQQLPLVARGMAAADATRLLHTLKSTAATLGARRLSAAAAAAERACIAAGGAVQPQRMESVDAEIRRALAAYERLAQQQAALTASSPPARPAPPSPARPPRAAAPRSSPVPAAGHPPARRAGRR